MSNVSVNLLAQPYSQLFNAVHDGGDEDVLAALRAMVEVCPEISKWLAAQAGTTERNLAHALEWMGDAMAFVEDGPGDSEMLEMEQLLDNAAAYGTLEEVMEILCETRPKDAKVLRAQYGLGGCDPVRVIDIAAELGVSRECVRRYGNRGRKTIREYMEARGLDR